MPRPNKGPQVAQRKNTGLWYVYEYRNGSRHWLTCGYESRGEAVEQLAYIILERKSGQRRELESVTVGEIMGYYLAHHVPHTNTPEKALSRHRLLKPFWAPLKASEVNKATFQKFCEWMREKRDYSNDTICTYIDHIIAAFNYAYDNDTITKLPKFWKPERAKPKKRFYTRKEIALLRKAAKEGQAGDYLPLFILIAVYTGVRSGAILKLRWCDVDLQNDVIDFSFAQSSRNKGYGIVPIPAKLKRELIQAKKRGTELGYVIHRNQMPIKSVKSAWRHVREKTGIEGTIHDFRRTHGSWLKQKGIPTGFISKNLSHSSTVTTDRVYAHLDDSYKKVIQNAF